MTKKEIINNVRIREGITWEQATRIVNSVFADISKEVAAGNDVYIPKFGRFFTTTVSEKRCKHPETKEYIMLPSHQIVRFRMAEGLRRKLGK